jgi:membrane-associated PAP2 superfamily phosphatase
MTDWKPAPLTRRHWLLPGALLAAGTAAIWIWDVDRRVARGFYDPAGPPFWPVGYGQPWDFLYTWAAAPAILLATAGLFLLAAGLARGRPWPRWAGLVILISLTAGPLLIANGLLHEFWGRPRPRQVEEFGGDRRFSPVLVPTFRDDEPGFPTGHAAGGFSLLVGYFALRGRRRRWAAACLWTGLGLGAIISVARIAQGGHFLSDGLWSAGVIWFTALGAAAWLRRRWTPRVTTRLPPWAVWLMAGLAGAALLGGYFANMPIQGARDRDIAVTSAIRTARIDVGVAGHRVSLRNGPGGSNVRIHSVLSGRGFPWARMEEQWEVIGTDDQTLHVRYLAAARGLRADHFITVQVTAPPRVKIEINRIPPPGP